MKDENEIFFEEHLIQINKLVCKLLIFTNIIGPLFALLSYLKIFHITYKFCALVLLLTFVFAIIQFFAIKFIKKPKFIMYQGLFLMTLLVGFLGTNNRIGVYISFALVPFLSCLYMKKRVTGITCAFGYLIMLASLWIKSKTGYLDSTIHNTAIKWFVSKASGFTIEFIFVFHATSSVANLFKRTIRQLNDKTDEIGKIQDKLIHAFADTVEFNDPTTGMHVKRTSEYVYLIATKLKERGYYTQELTDEKIRIFSKAAPLHDIGKFSVPNNILTKAGSYTKEEYELMKNHAQAGYELIEKEFHGLEDEEFVRIAGNMAHSHHEHWDGTGYPQGLKGEEIPLCARIMAAADVLDALLSKRLYKDAFSFEDAFQIIKESKGSQFEPCIADTVLELTDEVVKIASKYNSN